MKPAVEYQVVRPGLAVWQAYDPAVKTDLCCCAFDTAAGPVFCDPIPLARDAMDELLAGRLPQGILLTSANHERGALALARRFGIDVWAHSAARGHVAVTRWFEDGESLFGARAVTLPGFAHGETAWSLDGLLILGDALIHLPPYGFSILPDKYCEDPPLARQSLKKLLPLSVEIITFAHGLPIVTQAAARLAALVG